MTKDIWTIISLVLFIVIILVAFPGKVLLLFHEEVILTFTVLALVLIGFLILLKNKK